ncbi:MAG: FAD/NAD(P)-binding oxidoreductase [Acidimicrobiia bacterium]
MRSRKTNSRRRVLIVGGGNAGISLSARLARQTHLDVSVIEPSSVHFYQPLWTLVGGGLTSVDKSVRTTARVMPEGVTWVQKSVVSLDPNAATVDLDDGATIEYDSLVVCPGIELYWDALPGAEAALSSGAATSVYSAQLAPATWERIRRLEGGTAVFVVPDGPIKCPGAPQKIMYLASDYWRSQGILDRIRVILVLPGETLFGLPQFAARLEAVVERYGIEVRYGHEVVAVDGTEGTVTVQDRSTGDQSSIPYDFLHCVPQQGPADWIKASPLANEAGWVDVDPATLQHRVYDNVFSLGDVASTPNAKTGAAVRKQVPVVERNLLLEATGEAPSSHYNGYASCPLTTARNRVLLPEFDYDGNHIPSIPFINLARERYDMWLLKRYGLPWMYWNLILKGRM